MPVLLRSFTPMRFTLIRSILAIVIAISVARFASADYPKPSPYPIAWQLKFQHEKPKRIVLEVSGRSTPVAYWYITYTITNNTDQERTFLPVFEMLTKDGQVIRSDKNIPKNVFDTIKEREKKQFLEPWTKIGGELLLGEDQAKDGVAIWEEPTARMGQFSIYCGNLSGEAVHLKDEAGQPVKDAEGKPIILRKTLQLNYLIR